MKDELHEMVVTRSGGRCEVEIEDDSGSWLRCSARATEVHHMLPKSRGGRHLDEVLETYHLIDLCQEHHMQSHSRDNAEGLMIDGSVTWDKLTERPSYTGTDPVLSQRYTRIGG